MYQVYEIDLSFDNEFKRSLKSSKQGVIYTFFQIFQLWMALKEVKLQNLFAS